MSKYLNIASDKNILFVLYDDILNPICFKILTNFSLLLFKAKLIINFQTDQIYLLSLCIRRVLRWADVHKCLKSSTPTHTHTHPSLSPILSLSHTHSLSYTHFVFILSLSRILSQHTHSLTTHTHYLPLTQAHTLYSHTLIFFSSFLLPWLNIHFKRVILSRSREGMLRLITKGVLIRCLSRFVTLKRKSFFSTDFNK